MRNNDFGGFTETGIGTGDYFVLSRSNISNGGILTARTSNASAVVGIATTCLDGVFQVNNIEKRVGSGSTIRVFTEVSSGHGVNVTGLSSGAGNFYGAYSYTKFTTGGCWFGIYCEHTQWTNRSINCSTIQRTTKLLLDYT